MKKRFNDQQSAVSFLQSKGIAVDSAKKTIDTAKLKTNGLKIVSTIDYLVNYYKFMKI